MEIKLKCLCGSEAVFDGSTYINPGGATDIEGRAFVIQVHADRWLERHKKCVELMGVVNEPKQT
jgi:hypothetical protein